MQRAYYKLFLYTYIIDNTVSIKYHLTIYEYLYDFQQSFLNDSAIIWTSLCFYIYWLIQSFIFLTTNAVFIALRNNCIRWLLEGKCLESSYHIRSSPWNSNPNSSWRKKIKLSHSSSSLDWSIDKRDKIFYTTKIKGQIIL